MLSQGPFSYNRFDEMDAIYQKVYESKKADKDYDGDGKVESGKDEYFGSKDKAIKKAMGKSVKEEDDKKDLPPFMKDKKDDKKGDKKEKCTCKEEVMEHLMNGGFANNPVSAEVLFNHMSDDWLQSIEEAAREVDTGKVVKKEVIGKSYYPVGKMKKTSVTKKPDAFGGRFSK